MPEPTDVVDFREYRNRPQVRQKRIERSWNNKSPEQQAHLNDMLEEVFNDPEVLESEKKPSDT